jgi:hypothetical protein
MPLRNGASTSFGQLNAGKKSEPLVGLAQRRVIETEPLHHSFFDQASSSSISLSQLARRSA